MKRKKVTFYVYRTEDLTLELRQHLTVVVLRLNNQDVLNMNRARVTIVNSGNDSIKNFKFDIMVPGQHGLALADKAAKHVKLFKDIEINWDKERGTYNALFTITVPFLNRGEEFDINVFFDGDGTDVVVSCRMEDVTCRIRDPDYITSNTWGAVVLRGLLKGAAGVPLGR